MARGCDTRAKPSIVNVGYRYTNFWVVSVGTARLLEDLNWPGTMDQHRASLHRADVPLSQLRMALATHYHIDHAGLAQDLERAGVPLLVPDLQVPWIPRLRDHIKAADHHTGITLHDNRVTPIEIARAVLAELHIDGQIVHTPGHSPDGVSLLLDDGSVFTGNLTPPTLMTEDQADEVLASWDRLRQRAATTVYAAHGPVRPMPP